MIEHLSSQVLCLTDNNEAWSDKLSNQRIKRDPKGLSCICLVDFESNHDVKSVISQYSVQSDIMEDS